MVKGIRDSGGAASQDEGARMQGGKHDTAPRRSNAQIDPRVQTEIGKHLRAIYDDVINEPVPSKFMELLEQLEQSTTQKN